MIKKETTMDTTPREIVKTIDMKCDICGKPAKRPNREDWTDGSYDVNETTVECKVGTDYPSGGSWEEWISEICPTCFREKLIPWIESFGHTKIESKDVGW